MGEKNNIQTVVDLFCSKYTPATSGKDATETLSSQEIADAAAKQGLNIQLEELNQELEQRSFKMGAIPGTVSFQIKWLLVRKI